MRAKDIFEGKLGLLTERLEKKSVVGSTWQCYINETNLVTLWTSTTSSPFDEEEIMILMNVDT